MASKSSTTQVVLIPTPLGLFQDELFSPHFREMVYPIQHFVVEKAKTARHFLKALKHPTPLPEIQIFEWGKYAEVEELRSFIEEVVQSGRPLGVLSEAGCPGVADPGAEVVRMAHQRNLEVIPLIGPSSLLLALMASGLNGQRFSFQGYLPVKSHERVKRIKVLETQSRNFAETKIFIETPYRTQPMAQDLLKHLGNHTLLCIAADISLPTQWIKTMSVEKWRKSELPDLHKRPAVFLILDDSQMRFKKYGKR